MVELTQQEKIALAKSAIDCFVVDRNSSSPDCKGRFVRANTFKNDATHLALTTPDSHATDLMMALAKLDIPTEYDRIKTADNQKSVFYISKKHQTLLGSIIYGSRMDTGLRGSKVTKQP